MQSSHYSRFFVMVGLHFIAMYAMVGAFANVFNGFNQVYMATLMTASMVLIEKPLMMSMYKSKKEKGHYPGAWTGPAGWLFSCNKKTSRDFR